MSEINIIAQIIAEAADKALGIRPDGKPKPHDITAAEAIAFRYLLIRRVELPETSIIDRDGTPHVEVEGSEAGTWPANNSHAQNRKWGLEYLAASEAMKEWQAGEVERNKAKRRDELADEMAPRTLGLGPNWYENVSPGLQNAIDRIIELEAKVGKS